ncbi:hypothetical protein [Streptomyces sp. NRRL B-1347]|uniref:hypothetical protein n=1 Tax=Streptomyces sp. NRRL B-1347 TaxID=1476877 RepID=UPI0004C4F36A|nr:hypothetical protein [Streptomyces sp. NRRL B-1347]
MIISVRKGRKRAASAAVAALLLAGGAVGCGTDKKSDSAGGDLSPAAAVKKAAKNGERLKSFSFRMKGQVPGDGRVRAEASMTAKPLAMRMKMTSLDQPGQKAEIRLVDGGLYLGSGKPTAETDGKSWMKFDAKAMEKQGAGEPGGSSMSSQAEKNPAEEAAFLTGSKDVKKVGEETVDGVETTHYAGTVTLDELRADLKDEDPEKRKSRTKNIEKFADMGIEKLSMDMWIDGDDRTKQFRTQGKGDKGKFDMTITFFDVNKPVRVTAPPKGQVMDLAEMMKDTGAKR